jgi:hypothetical protein
MNTFGLILAYFLCLIFIGLTFFHTKEKRFRIGGMFGAFAFGCFIVAQLVGHITPTLVGDLTLEQILCWGFALLFLGAAIYFIHKQALPYGFALSIISIFCCFCGFSSVQALLKTHMLWTVTETLKTYGDKIDNYQKINAELQKSLTAKQNELVTNQFLFVAEMNIQKEELKAIQTKIAESEVDIIRQQLAITNQFSTLSVVHTELLTAQTNIDSQTKKISDVEYWVQHLYQKMTTETFSVTDTNHLLYENTTDGHARYFIRLSNVPISGSVEMFARDHTSLGEIRLKPTQYVKNISQMGLYRFDTNTTTLTFRYIADNRETNFYKTFPKIWFDENSWNIFPQPD